MLRRSRTVDEFQLFDAKFLADQVTTRILVRAVTTNQSRLHCVHTNTLLSF